MNINSGYQESVYEWLMRKTTSASIRRVADLPMVIASDVGLIRTENQDRAAVFRFQMGDTNDASLIAILCDGMGGMVDGATCASLAISNFLSGYMHSVDFPLNERIINAIMQADEAVYAKYKGSGGSTLSALIIDSLENAFIVNVGDSRVYSLTGHELSQLTIDDTLAGQLGYAHGQNGLLQYIGMGQGIEPHLTLLSENYMSSRIFLTSDGMHFLNKQVMESIIRYAPDSAYAVKRLIELAKWCGGHDNASAIAVDLSALEKTHFNSSALEIWDAFAERQVIVMDKANVKIQRAALIKKPFDKVTLKVKSTIREQQRSVREPRKKTIVTSGLKKKTIKKDATADAKATHPPQVLIGFENK